MVDLLTTVFLSNAVVPRALFSEKMADAQRARLVKQAIDRGLVREYVYDETYGSHRREYRYLAITAAGIVYLKLQQHLPWTQYLPSVKRVTVFGQGGMSDPKIAYSVRCGNSIAFMRAIRADMSDYILTGEAASLPQRATLDYQDNPILEEELEPEEGRQRKADRKHDTGEAGNESAEKTILSDIRREAALRMREHGVTMLQRFDEGLTFYTAAEMRAMLKSADLISGQATSFVYVRYTGVLVTQEDSFLVYHAKHSGLPWMGKFEQHDIRVLRKFDAHCLPQPHVKPGTAKAIGLVYNEKNFGDIIKNKFLLRPAGDIIGKDFQSFRLVPLSQYGADLIRWVATNDAQSRNAYVENAALEVCDARENHGAGGQAFQFRDSEGMVFNGTEMDIKFVFSAMAYLQSLPSTRFKVLCFPWQEKFYRTIWPDTQYRLITG